MLYMYNIQLYRFTLLFSDSHAEQCYTFDFSLVCVCPCIAYHYEMSTPYSTLSTGHIE